MSSLPVYCLCRQPYDGKRFMIECDLCQDWFHGGCVCIEEKKADDIDIYHCPNCEVLHGPSIMKKQHGSSQKLTGLKREPLRNVSLLFIHQLQSKTFESCEEVILKPTGSQLTVEFLEKHSFSRPILILKKDGLGMKIPPTTFTVRDVEKWVGSDNVIDAIDVASQASFKMRLGDFVKYYYSEKRENVFNIISLEFSNTLLSNIVEMPKIVRKLSWVENLWPEECGFDRPNVQKYCFMSVKDSYTDFHIAFGAPSIWYHVLKGEKIFYLIQPTNDNLTLFECWNKFSKHKEVFFGDQVDKCYKCSVKQGQTLFIPAGWIHAVLTPVDCLAFGGKFIHSLNIEMQLKAYEIQKKLSIADLFIFPRFETICWHVGKEILDILGGLREHGRCPAYYLVQGCKALGKAFQAWTRKEVLPDLEDELPKTMQTTQLIEDLTREISLVEDTFQHNILKMNTIFEVQQPFLSNSTSLPSPNNSTSVSKLTFSLPFKSGSKEKYPKHKDIFTKAEQRAKENPVLESNGQHDYNAMDLNHQVLRAGSSQNVEFNITSTCWNNSDVCSNSDKFFDGNERLLMAEGSAKRVKSLPKNRGAKSTKKKDNSRLVEEQVKGDNFDVSSKDELQFQETLCKEKEGLILRPKFQTNMFHVKFCIEQNQIHERWETVTTSENYKTEQEMVPGCEDKLRNANGSDRILDPLKAKKQVEKPDSVVLTEDQDSSSIKVTMEDNVFLGDSQSSSPKPAPSSHQAMQMRRMEQSNERSGSGLDTVSNSSVSKRTPWKRYIKRLVYTRIQGNLGTSSKDAEDSYLLLESDHDDDDEDEYDHALRSLSKKRKF